MKAFCYCVWLHNGMLQLHCFSTATDHGFVMSLYVHARERHQFLLSYCLAQKLVQHHLHLPEQS